MVTVVRILMIMSHCQANGSLGYDTSFGHFATVLFIRGTCSLKMGYLLSGLFSMFYSEKHMGLRDLKISLFFLLGFFLQFTQCPRL